MSNTTSLKRVSIYVTFAAALLVSGATLAQVNEKNVEGGCTTPRCFKPGQQPNSNAKRSMNPPSYVIIDGHIYVLAFRIGKTNPGDPPPYNPMSNEAFYRSVVTGQFVRVFDHGGKRMDWSKLQGDFKIPRGNVEILPDPPEGFIDVAATDYKFNFIPTDKSYYTDIDETDYSKLVIRVFPIKWLKSYNKVTGRVEYFNRMISGCGKGRGCGIDPRIIIQLERHKDGRWIVPPFIDPNSIAPADRGIFKWTYEIGPDGSVVRASK